MTGERARFSKDMRFVATTREAPTAIIVSMVGVSGVIRTHEVPCTSYAQLKQARREAHAIRDGFVERYNNRIKEIRDARANSAHR